MEDKRAPLRVSLFRVMHKPKTTGEKKNAATMVNPERPEKNSSPPPSPLSSSSSFSLLPDEITVNYLARISRSYYPTFSVVSKSFLSLISSTELYAARSQLGSTEHCLYVCLWDHHFQFPQWFTLWINPNRTRPRYMITQRKKKNTTRKLLVPIPSANLPSLARSIVSVGSEIYVIGGPVDDAPASAVRILDCGSHTWRDGPSMKVARKYAAACVHDGKIYVLGGCKGFEEDESWGEVFDTKTQSWECLPDPGSEIPKHTICRIAEIEGKIIFMNVNGDTYAYNPKQCKWECCGNVMIAMSECVVENVSYVYSNTIGRYKLWWSKCQKFSWRDVKGLESLGEIYKSSGGSRYNKLVCCGEKLFVFWESSMKVKRGLNKKEIWCAEIVLEKRKGGEIWGQVQWVNVVHTVPISSQLLQCLLVTL